MDAEPELSYTQRCELLASQVKAYALTLFATRLAVGWMLALPGALDLKALILLLILRDLRACGPRAQRWSVVLVVLELFELLTWLVVALAIRRWGLTTIGGLDLVGPTPWITATLALVFIVWSGWLGWRLLEQLRAHPSDPPGRGFRMVMTLVIVVSVALAPLQVWRLRHLIFSQWREERSHVTVVAGQPVWERVLVIGPGEQERLGLVLLMPVSGTEPPAEPPPSLGIRETTEERFVLGPEDADPAQRRELPVGSALWWDPERKTLTVLRTGLDLEWLEHPDRLDMLLDHGPPSRLEPAPEDADGSGTD
jgi:hypothetical protein